MKSLRFLTLCLALLVWGSVDRASGAADAKNKDKASAAATNSITTVPEVVIPQAAFEFGPKTAKDPFFPLSTRSPHLPVQTVADTGINPSMFKLKGLSGTPQFPLALINNRTLAPGETAIVTTLSGKHKIHCLEIKQFSAVIRVEGQFEPIEIFLPKSDR